MDKYRGNIGVGLPSGASYEQRARVMLEALRFRNVRKANLSSGYDLDAIKDGKSYAIEVKGIGIGNRFNLRWDNIQSLVRAFSIGKLPLVVTINSDGHGVVWQPFHIDMV